MKSRYLAAEARQIVDRYAPQYGEDLALRVYTSRLLGNDPELVLHGGGNTSVKTRVTELTGDATEVLYVKGSGADLASIEPRGFPACRLAHLRRCAAIPAMTDEQMVRELRGQMIDPGSPTPSVEALLHAFLPAKFVDHTHADAVLAVVDQPGSRELVREVFGERALFIPYVMPGFDLARAVAAAWPADGAIEPSCMILDKHGIFTWGATAEESYERMIELCDRAERWLSAKRAARGVRVTSLSAGTSDDAARLSPLVRGAVSRASGKPWITTFRASPPLAAFCARADLSSLSARGCVTPDHVIRTKGRPLVVEVGPGAPADDVARALEAGLSRYAADYRAYFRRSCEARGAQRKELDPWPRIILWPRVGAFTLGRSRRDAEIAADIYEHTAAVVELASSIGGYEPVGELDLFDVEYWSLEQAKLARGASAPAPLEARIALVTGAASGIGEATARALCAAGAHVMLTDRSPEPLEALTRALAAIHGDHRVMHAVCDVTDASAVRRAVSATSAHFGGLDVVVSNAGTAATGLLHTEQGDARLRESIEVNLFGHQNVARAAADVMIAQGTGGVLLFNASKSAFNQGPEFGPYAVAKTALVALMRQCAVDLGKHKIRANAVNADRVRTALFGGGVAEVRARARGLSVDEYFRQNLLARETTADDVAGAFVYLASAHATTGCVVTVDGGNAAAFPR